jgi:transposase
MRSPGYLRPAYDIPAIYLYRDAVDFRKQAHGLAVLVEQELGHNPFSGTLYAFTNRQRNKIKCLFWEDNGFVLYYKALAEEKFKWPKASDELVQLTGEQMNWLLDGYDISLLKGHKKCHYESIN